MSESLRAWDETRQASLLSLVTRADRGDETLLPAVKDAFDHVPGLWDFYADLAMTAENAMIGLVAETSALTREALRRKLAAMRDELAGVGASPIERLLVDRVVVCWLQTQQADIAYARSLRDSSPKDADYCQRRQDRAARQYLKAVRSLATVRRLLVSPIQVNVADKQVNIVSQTGTA